MFYRWPILLSIIYICPACSVEPTPKRAIGHRASQSEPGLATSRSSDQVGTVSNDAFEPNQSVAFAAYVELPDPWAADSGATSVSLEGLQLPRTDTDYFRFQLPAQVGFYLDACTSRAIRIVQYRLEFPKVGPPTATPLSTIDLTPNRCLTGLSVVRPDGDYVIGVTRLGSASTAITYSLWLHARIPDSDDDGHDARSDNCPDTYNPNQRDYNDDDIGDECDPDLDPCTEDDPYACRGHIAAPGSRELRYFRNYSLGTTNHAVYRALIYVHGHGRDAQNYFKKAVQAAQAEAAASNTLIIAPHFVGLGDAPETDELRWDSNGSWSQGDDASVAPISSFAVMDIILAMIADADRFPNLEEIVLAGHSEGGQFVQRYAAGGVAENVLDVPIRYLVANPSSYMYLNNRRPPKDHETTNPSFSIPFTTDAFNVYRYGPDFRNPYMALTPISTIRSRYISRDVTYLIGEDEQDVDCDEDNDEHCDASAGARWQGYNRYYRAYAYKRYLDTYWSDHHHDLIKVDDIGHSSSIIKKPEMRAVIFRD